MVWPTGKFIVTELNGLQDQALGMTVQDVFKARALGKCIYGTMHSWEQMELLTPQQLLSCTIVQAQMLIFMGLWDNAMGVTALTGIFLPLQPTAAGPA